jgi:hypothetical protein
LGLSAAKWLAQQRREREATRSKRLQPLVSIKSNTMRSLLVSIFAATAVFASAATILPAHANAAARHPHHRAHVVAHVRQDPYRSFNMVDPPVVRADPYLNYRWPPSGGAT